MRSRCPALIVFFAMGTTVDQVSEFKTRAQSPIERSMDRLLHAVQDLSLARSIDEIRTIVRTAARELTHADGATFVLREGNFCFYADEDAIGPLWKGQRFPLELCISGWSMLHRESVVIRDIYVDARVPQDAYRKTFVKSLAMTPIRLADPIGAIGIYWADQHEASDDDIRLIEALAGTTAVALENVRLLERLEARIEELQTLDRAKDEFLMTLSHELRSPLNAISGWADLLSAEGALAGEYAANGIETIKRNARAQTQLVDNLLDTTKIFSRRISLESESLNLMELISKVVAEQRPLADGKSIFLDVRQLEDVGYVTGDAKRLAQVFSHLLGNALKFSPAGRNIEIKLTRRGPMAMAQLVDYGIGIEPEFLPHVFDRFRQANSSTTREHGGLGLGLAIAHALVEAHGGSSKVESEGRNKGSTFSIELPLSAFKSPARAGSKDEASPEGKPLADIRVLVVDDEPDARALVSTVLQLQGAVVYQAADAKEAVLALESHRPDLLISDIGMPHEDGISLMRRIRSFPPGGLGGIRAIALTGFVGREHEIEAIEAGFDLFLGKPFQAKILVETAVKLARASMT